MQWSYTQAAVVAAAASATAAAVAAAAALLAGNCSSSISRTHQITRLIFIRSPEWKHIDAMMGPVPQKKKRREQA